MAVNLTRLTHKIAIQLHVVGKSCTIWQFSLQATSPETFGYTLISLDKVLVIMQCSGSYLCVKYI
jgi:hypothetical protein